VHRPMTCGAQVLLCACLTTVACLTPPSAAPLPAAVLVLDSRSTNAALNLGGDNALTVRVGDVVVNSCHNFGLFNVNSRVEAKTGAIRVCGGAHRLGSATFSPDPVTGAGSVSDPYAEVVWPQPQEVASPQKLFLSGNQDETLTPGLYQGGLSCVGKSLHVTLQPGLYVITDGDLFVSGATLTGQGVTILMSGDAPGKVLLANGCSLNLSAPKAGALKDLLLASWRASEDNDTGVAFSGATAVLDGVVYAPQGCVGLSSNARVTAAAVVAYSLIMNSGATLDVLGQR
jgi:hypothetical protein